MAQAGANLSTKLTRRSAIAASAAVVIPFPRCAGANREPPDPIFRAIARHKLAEERLELALASIETDFTSLQWRRMRRPADLASVELIGTVPTTAAGVAALLWYVTHSQIAGYSFSCEPIARLIRRRASQAFKRQGAA